MQRHQISTLEPTRYEIVAHKATGGTFLVGYTPRVSRHGLLAVLRNHAAAVIATLEIGETDQINFFARPRPYARVGNGAVIEFTGRTQREATQFGEHPRIA